MSVYWHGVVSAILCAANQVPRAEAATQLRSSQTIAQVLGGSVVSMRDELRWSGRCARSPTIQKLPSRVSWVGLEDVLSQNLRVNIAGWFSGVVIFREKVFYKNAALESLERRKEFSSA